MAYVIGDDCVSCGACAGGCPVGAIAEGAEHYEILASAVALVLVHVLLELFQRRNHYT